MQTRKPEAGFDEILSSKSGKISVLESEPGFSNAVASYVCVQSGQP